MGCVSSRRDIKDIPPNFFQVMNVDELGQPVSPGELELTETELVLHQNGKTTTRWPLRCLRRYGFDAEIFSFESGRRCPTGPGIYAFRCRRAEQLFNMLQQHIQIRNLSEELVTVATELAIPAVSTGPPVSARPTVDQSYLDSLNRTVVPRTSQSSRFSRPGSVTSNGPASPPIALSPTPTTSEPPTAEHNNNKRLQHSYSNTFTLLETDTNVNSTYINLEPTSSPTLSSCSEPYAQLNMDSEAENCHLYMNVVPGETLTPKNIVESPPLLDDEEKEDPKHCYANLNPEEIESLTMAATQGSITHSNSLEMMRKVNYIVLDLESKSETPTTIPPPESPQRPAKGYATIDFNKTVALSHSVNPCLDLDNEGSRKTRHNSTIGELAPILARHSTSLSD